jgi:HEAT repeat protein
LKERIEQAIVDLGSEEKARRDPAARTLEEIAAPAVLPLIEALQSESWRVRAGAARVLAKIGDVRAIPALLQALQDAHEIVRWQAQRALKARREREAIESLLMALRVEDEFVRQVVTNLLGAFDDAQTIVALICALEDPSPYVRRGAAQALIKIGEPATDPLFRTMQVTGPLQTLCAEILALLKDTRAALHLVPCLAYFNQPTGERAEQFLRSVGNASTLPRRIVAETRLSVDQRVAILNWLELLRFYQWNISYMDPLPDVLAFCRQILQEKETAYHEGAQQILAHYTLLRGSGRDTSQDHVELLRPPSPGFDPTLPTTLIRPTGEDTPSVESRAKPGPWQRLFRLRRD